MTRPWGTPEGVELERYSDAPQGDARRRVVQSAQLDVPSPDAMPRTMALLGLDGAPPIVPPAPHRLGRWLVTGVVGLALLGGWVVRSSRASHPTVMETEPRPRDPSAIIATAVPAPAPPAVDVPTQTVPIAAPAVVVAAPAPLLPEKRREGEDDLGAQLALIDGARALLVQGNARDALARLKEYDSRYPAGALGPEATALRVEALLRSGEQARGRALGDRFVAQHPNSPYAARIRSLLAQAP